jgi:hypothetical protein
LTPPFRCFWWAQVFRPLLNITGDFTAEELEVALITPNEILDDVHMPLLKVGSLVVQLELVFPFLDVAVYVWKRCMFFCCMLLIAS